MKVGRRRASAAAWLRKCASFAPVSNPIPKAGRPAITLTSDAGKWPRLLWTRQSRSHGVCRMRAAPMPRLHWPPSKKALYAFLNSGPAKSPMVLRIAYLRKRTTPADEQKFLAELSRLTIHIAQADALTVIRDGTAAAVRFGLTAYDAAYLDLALRAGLPLASL